MHAEELHFDLLTEYPTLRWEPDKESNEIELFQGIMSLIDQNIKDQAQDLIVYFILIPI